MASSCSWRRPSARLSAPDRAAVWTGRRLSVLPCPPCGAALRSISPAREAGRLRLRLSRRCIAVLRPRLGRYAMSCRSFVPALSRPDRRLCTIIPTRSPRDTRRQARAGDGRCRLRLDGEGHSDPVNVCWEASLDFRLSRGRGWPLPASCITHLERKPNEARLTPGRVYIFDFRPYGVLGQRGFWSP